MKRNIDIKQYYRKTRISIENGPIGRNRLVLFHNGQEKQNRIESDCAGFFSEFSPNCASLKKNENYICSLSRFCWTFYCFFNRIVPSFT